MMFISIKHARQRGATLIEVVVSFLLIAIGLLGITALQVTGAQFGHDAHLRSQITLAMYDFVDRVRLNKDNATSYVVDDLALSGTAPSCNQSTAQSASNDMDCWRNNIMTNNILPSNSTLTVSNEGGGEYEIEIAWTDRESTTHNISYRFEP